MARKPIGIGIAIGVIVVLAIIFFQMVQMFSNNDSQTLFTTKEMVIDEAQFTIKPTIHALKNSHELVLDITIVSYINPEILSIDFNKQILLETKTAIISPSKWHLTNTSNHNISGQLVFNVPHVLHAFSIKIFTFSDHEIIWD